MQSEKAIESMVFKPRAQEGAGAGGDHGGVLRGGLMSDPEVGERRDEMASAGHEANA